MDGCSDLGERHSNSDQVPAEVSFSKKQKHTVLNHSAKKKKESKKVLKMIQPYLILSKGIMRIISSQLLGSL